MSLSDYSSMEQEIRNAPEPKVLPKGSEVKARIISVNTGVSEKQKSYGARWYMPLFDVPDDPMVKEFNTFIWDPLDHGKIDPKQAARNADIFNKFTRCFKIDLSKPFSWTDDLPNKTGWVILGQVDDPQYGLKNTISSYVTGPRNAGARPSSPAPQQVGRPTPVAPSDDDFSDGDCAGPSDDDTPF